MTYVIFSAGVFSGIVLTTSFWLFARALRHKPSWHRAVIYRKGRPPEHVNG